jgi:hypothetical protein
MSTLPPDVRAWRQELGLGCLAFVVGIVAVAAGITYLHVRYVIPEKGWEGVVGCILHVLQFSLLGGFALWAIVVVPLNRWHYYRGIYRCNFCGRPLKRGTACQCLPEEFHKTRRRSSKWRHYRRRIPMALTMYAALCLPALAIAIAAYRHGRAPFLPVLIVSHALVCGIAILLGEIGMSMVETAHLGRRLRKRWNVFRPLFGIWPLGVILVVILCKFMGVGEGTI